MFFRDEYSFLSNFFLVKIYYKGKLFNSSEHAFQSEKTNDIKQREEIINAETPGKAKRLGKKCKIREDWNLVKESIMEEIIDIKFSIPFLKNKLLKINGEIIEYNNWHDNYWGDCLCDKCKETKGQNKLGKILMRKRDKLKIGV